MIACAKTNNTILHCRENFIFKFIIMNIKLFIETKSMKNGDEEAYIWIYNEYVNLLCSYAAKIVGCMVTAEDIVQDIFVKLWEERETIKITKSMQAYLHTCVRNKCQDYLDHNRVKRNYEESFWDENKDSYNSNNPEIMLIAKDTECMINDEMDALPEQCRRVFSMYWKEGLKYDEIAEKLVISIGTVKAQINRARTKLWKTLKNME
jgi:RNA polymerase sigma-70 factor (ECF subfamily)